MTAGSGAPRISSSWPARPRSSARAGAAGGAVDVAPLAALAGDEQLVDPGKPSALPDPVDLRVHALEELPAGA